MGSDLFVTGMTLTSGVKTTIRNPNPANCRFELKTAAGTHLIFPIAAGGSFDITPGPDIVFATLHVDEVAPLGPRPVNDDVKD